MKHRIGILVQFSQTRDDEYDPYNTRYKAGERGYTIAYNDEAKTYTVKVGMGDIVDVPEDAIFNPNDSVQQKIEAHLRKKQEKKEFKDTEGRIGGSKKEKAAYKSITMANIADLEQDENLAIELIKKDKVFPKVDPGKERENGTGAGTAFLKVKLREAYAGAPPNNKDKRRVYVAMAEFLTKAMAEVVTIENFNNMLDALRKDGMAFFMGILLGPDVYQSIKEKREADELAHAEIKKKLFENREVLDNLDKEIQEKFNWQDVPKELSDQHDAASDKHRELQRQAYGYSDRTLSTVEKQFVEKMTGEGHYYDRNQITFALFKEVFSARFANFVWKNSDAVRDIFDKAFDYESLSVPESIRLIESYSSTTKDHLLAALHKISMVKNLTGSVATKEYFDKHGDYGFSGGEFRQWGNKYFYGKDLKGEAQYTAYKKRYIEAEEKRVEEYKKMIAAVEHKYRARDNNWEWAFPTPSTGSGTEAKAGAEIKINTYPPLSHITRKGGILVTDADVTVESIREKFGFKEIEFGQSLKDKEAKEHIRHFLAAMADLADILNWDIVHLNKLGRLSIAFASRGSGKASAHYEQLRRVINITKSRGGGALAHEYMHYLDNILPSIERTGGYKDWASLPAGGSLWDFERRHVLVENQEVELAIKNLFRFIYFRKSHWGMDQGKPVKMHSSTELNGKVIVYKNIEASTDSGKSYSPGIDADNIDDYWAAFQQKYSRYRFIEDVRRGDWQVFAWIVRKFGYPSYKLPFQSRTTAFFANSANMSSDYWSRPWELFARSFETYIYDKLQKAGRENNYLVSGAYFDRPEGVYPQGEEREILYMLYEELMAAIQDAYNIPKFNPWTTERVDESIAIESDEKKTGSTSSPTTEATDESEAGKKRALKKIAKFKKLLVSPDSATSKELGGLVEKTGKQINDFLLTLTH